ncbi:Uu.00g035730.m01.CDS01 [Anthostomella pinea]|uniref:Uu.00g035730.m01.CDS01 n=1 Tax=Anthostomella pinea TaxID=933095 RepID=A0AAI8V9A3_9PEZI|nr:Uu.00g035730.m01.CDS01 [Anthostomella pinea]
MEVREWQNAAQEYHTDLPTSGALLLLPMFEQRYVASPEDVKVAMQLAQVECVQSGSD